MIWIHGGGFIEGGALIYTPSELVTENDVIVVVIQYRLGVLGFLSSHSDVMSGNQGLWDQNLAIRWVKQNIRSFGGDAESITIFGESAGAASVGLQLLSPHSRGLFSRAILQSGSPTAAWAVSQSPSKAFYSVANRTGCLRDMGWTDTTYYTLTGGRQRASDERIVQCLRRVGAAALVQAAQGGDGGDSVSLSPSVDGDFLPRHPTTLLSDAEYLATNDVTSRDVMMGVNNDEGSLGLQLYQGLTSAVRAQFPDLSEEELADKLPTGSETERTYMQSEVEYRYNDLKGDQRRRELLIDVLQFFSSQSGVDEEPQTQDLADTFADILFVVPLVRFARALAATGSKKSGKKALGRRYVYHFNHYPVAKAGQEDMRGMYHGEDIVYQFDPSYVLDRQDFDQDDVTVSNTFKAMLCNFAKTGDPQLALAAASGGLWPEFTLEEERYLSLEPTPRVGDHLYNKRVALWLDLLPALLNSTRVEATQSWINTPWNQQENANSYHYNNHNHNNNQPFSPAGGKTYYFNGRISFYKL